MPYPEGFYSAEQSQSHAGNLAGMVHTVSLRKPRHHHVSVADCLNLRAYVGLLRVKFIDQIISRNMQTDTQINYRHTKHDEIQEKDGRRMTKQTD